MNCHEKTTRTILVHKAPQTQLNSLNEQEEVSNKFKTNNLEYKFRIFLFVCARNEQSPELDDLKNSLVPEYDMVVAQLSMTETLRLTNSIKNINTEDDDWELRVNKYLQNKQNVYL